MLTEGQVSDDKGAAIILPALPDADILIADRGDDADWFRSASESRDIQPRIPGRKGRKKPVEYDEERDRDRNLIEHMFGRLKHWRRISTRHDRCAHTFMSAICIAATEIFWL